MAKRIAPKPRPLAAAHPPAPAAPCPCGLGEPYADCCAPFHRGAEPPTAEALMRSRYTAYVAGDRDYLLRTWHPSTRPRLLTLEDAQDWTGLTIVGRTGGGLLDAEGTVEFKARFEVDGRPGVMHERSRFVRDGGGWRYVDEV